MMKIALAFVFSLSAFSFTNKPMHAQRMAEVAGSYRVITMVSNKGYTPAPSFVFLRADSTYVWCTDSTAKQTDASAIRGRWSLTSQSEIRLQPDSASPMREVRLYARSAEGVYNWRYVETDGKKMMLHQMEMTVKLVRRSDE